MRIPNSGMPQPKQAASQATIFRNTRKTSAPTRREPPQPRFPSACGPAHPATGKIPHPRRGALPSPGGRKGAPGVRRLRVAPVPVRAGGRRRSRRAPSRALRRGVAHALRDEARHRAAASASAEEGCAHHTHTLMMMMMSTIMMTMTVRFRSAQQTRVPGGVRGGRQARVWPRIMQLRRRTCCGYTVRPSSSRRRRSPTPPPSHRKEVRRCCQLS